MGTPSHRQDHPHDRQQLPVYEETARSDRTSPRRDTTHEVLIEIAEVARDAWRLGRHEATSVSNEQNVPAAWASRRRSP
jgi:hypothetical protein